MRRTDELNLAHLKAAVDEAAHASLSGAGLDLRVLPSDDRAASDAWAQSVARGFLDRAKLERMKPGAILLNTGRGGIVDEAAHPWGIKMTRVEIKGPAAPSWKHGRRSVRDGRGPRDTYG